MGFDIHGKTALVTGANRGIGKALVEALVEHGAARVYAAVRDPGTAAPLVAAYGDKVIPITLDLAKPETITEAARIANDVQLVVNNAGILKTVDALSPNAIDALREELEVNAFGLLRMAQAFATVLKANGGGAFVQLNSVASMKCFPAITTYCASKAAAYSITQALRELLAAQGTQVVSVHPGPIATDMAHSAGFGDVAEPPSLVADSILNALDSGAFHAFPDSVARQIGGAYRSFAESVVEANLDEG